MDFGNLGHQQDAWISICSKKGAETLLPLIEKFVKKGTETWTGQWTAYSRLSKMGKASVGNCSSNIHCKVQSLISTKLILLFIVAEPLTTATILRIH